MELNEAISYERKEAEVFTQTSNALYRDFYQISLNCQERADYHEQLAEWLTELQSDRKLISVIRSIVWDNSLYDGIKIDKLRRLLSAYKESEAENEQ